jgi:hypothetical protein
MYKGPLKPTEALFVGDFFYKCLATEDYHRAPPKQSVLLPDWRRSLVITDSDDLDIDTCNVSIHIAFVAGSAKEIGCAIAIRLAQDRFDVALDELPAAKTALEDLAAEL